MGKSTILLLIFTLATVVAIGTNPIQVIDSLNLLLKKQRGNEKIRTIQALIEQYRILSPSKSIMVGESTLAGDELAKLPSAQAQILRSMANSARYAGDLELAEQYYRRAILLCKTSGNNEQLLAHLLTDWGYQLQQQGRYDEALNTLNEALSLAKTLHNDTLLMKASLNLGNTAFDLNNIHEALQHYRQSLSLAQKLNDQVIQARTLLNMGMAHWQFDNNDQAIHLLKEAAAIMKPHNDLQFLGMAYNNLGLIYFSDKKQYDSASYFFDASLTIREQLASPVPIAHVLVNIANLLVATNKASQSLALYQRALQIFTQAGLRSQIVRTQYHLGEAWLSMGNQKESTAIFEKTLQIAQQDELTSYEELINHKLLDLYAAQGNWKAFREHFGHFRTQHSKLIEAYNTVSVRENELRDTLQTLQVAYDMLHLQNSALEKRAKTLESILISLAVLVATILLLLILRRLISNRFYPR